MNPLFSEKLRGLTPYHVNHLPARIVVDANENPYDVPASVKEEILSSFREALFNRYPDSESRRLKEALASYSGVETERIAVGAGSDEIIHILMQVFLNPGDKVAVHSPTFSMYHHYARMSNGRIAALPPGPNLQLDPLVYRDFILQEQPRVTFLCNPNNPTGQVLSLEEVELLVQAAPGAFILDEAYVEFSGQSALELLEKYPKLVILRTLSKAFGIASIRLGYALAAPDIIQAVDAVRSPFNVNTLTQLAATVALEQAPLFLERVKGIREQRDQLLAAMAVLPNLTCLPSAANFILFTSPRSQALKEKFAANHIRVRVFGGPILEHYIRFSLGTPQENQSILAILQEVCHD